MNDIVSMLRDRDRVADARTRQQLRLAADTIENLWTRLLRADTRCENMHHGKHELHRACDPCPVEAWVRAGMEMEEKPAKEDE